MAFAKSRLASEFNVFVMQMDLDQTHRRYLLYNELEIGRALNPVH